MTSMDISPVPPVIVRMKGSFGYTTISMLLIGACPGVTLNWRKRAAWPMDRSPAVADGIEVMMQVIRAGRSICKFRVAVVDAGDDMNSSSIMSGSVVSMLSCPAAILWSTFSIASYIIG